MNHVIRHLATIAFAALLSINCNASSKVNKELVIAEMNYCINSLTTISENKSLVVLNHELDQLLNNLTMEEIVELYEVADFRGDLVDKISDLQITEEEKSIIKRVNTIKRNNLAWEAVSSALNNVMFILPSSMPVKGAPSSMAIGTQVAFYSILSLARTGVEYKKMDNEQNIEELQAMWQIRKGQMTIVKDLRKNALDLVFKLFQKYGLNERDRLTEASAGLLNKIKTEPDLDKKIRLLNDNRGSYSTIADYYYYLGMAYVDKNNYKLAKPILDRYLELYSKAPIFRYDEKSGCVALAKLAFEQSLSKEEKENLISTALKNLPNNGAALIQCALTYYAMGEQVKSFNLLRNGVDNLNISDRDAIVMTIVHLMPQIKKHPIIRQQINSAVRKCNDISINSYVAFIVSDNNNKLWYDISTTIKLRDAVNEHLWIESSINKDFYIVIPSKYSVNLQDINIYREEFDDGILTICQNTQEIENSFTLEKAQKNVDCFKSNPSLLYMFATPISGNKHFKIKANINYNDILNKEGCKGEYIGLNELPLGRSELEDIVDFCKDQTNDDNKYSNSIIIKSEDNNGWFPNKKESYNHSFLDAHWLASKGNSPFTKGINTWKYQEVPRNLTKIIDGNKYKVHFIGSRLTYKPKRFLLENRHIIQIVFNGTVKTILSFTIDGDKIVPYSAQVGSIIVYYKAQKVIKVHKKTNVINNQKISDKAEKPWYKFW